MYSISIEYRETKWCPLPAWGCEDDDNRVTDDVITPDVELSREAGDVIVMPNVVCVTDWCEEGRDVKADEIIEDLANTFDDDIDGVTNEVVFDGVIMQDKGDDIIDDVASAFEDTIIDATGDDVFDSVDKEDFDITITDDDAIDDIEDISATWQKLIATKLVTSKLRFP